LGADGVSAASGNLTNVLSFLAQRKADEVVGLPGGASVPVAELLSSVRSAVNSAAKECSEDAKDAQAVAAPLQRLSSALDNIKRAEASLAKARAQNGWDEQGYKKKLTEVKNALAGLETL